MMRARKIRRIVGVTLLWMLSVLMALGMLAVGVGKVMGAAPWPQYFEAWGYPSWFRVSVGVFQTAGGVLLLVPPVAFYAAAGLVVVMLGAEFTELSNDVGLGPVTPLIYIALLSVILLVRGRRWWQLRAGREGQQSP